MIYYSRMQVLSFKYILSRLSNQLQYSFLKARNKISIFDPILLMRDLIPLTNDLLFSCADIILIILRIHFISTIIRISSPREIFLQNRSVGRVINRA